MKLSDLLHAFATQLANHKDAAGTLDTLIESRTTDKIGTAGTLHLYAMEVPAGTTFLEDVPVTIVPPGDLEPTGGFLLRRQGRHRPGANPGYAGTVDGRQFARAGYLGVFFAWLPRD